MLRKVRTFHSLIGVGILGIVGAVPLACSDDQFSGCEANRTCPARSTAGETGGGGEAGDEADKGGTSGSATGGSSGLAGASGADDGGQGGNTTGGNTTGGNTTGGSATGGHAGMGEDGGAAGEGGMTEPGDRPTIVSVSPGDGEIGVTLDTDLVVTFSKPMDRTSAEAAFLSQDIRAGGVAFTWNGNSTVLTIDPQSDLTYAEVTSPTDGAPNYAASISDVAQDLSGNRLADDFEWSFRTIRRVTHAMPVPFQNVFEVHDTLATTPCPSAADYVMVGELGPSNALVSVDISALPAEILQWEAATLSGLQMGAEGTPYGSGTDNLGVVRAYDVDVIPPTSVTWTTPNTRELGVFSMTGVIEVKSISVIISLTDDYVNRTLRGQRSQYRLAFDRSHNNMNGNPDLVGFDCDSFTLTARYLVR
jgi:hypothetical protein